MADGSLQEDAFTVIDGLLFLRDFSAKSVTAVRLVVPRAMTFDVLLRCHSVPEAGHQGVRRTCAIVHDAFYWNGWKSDVAKFVAECATCQQFNGARYTRKEQLPSLPIVATAFNHLLSVDIGGPYHHTEQGNMFTLMMQDVFSHLACVVPLPDTKAPTIAKAIIESWIGPHGAPLKIVTDNGANLVGVVMADIYKIFKIYKVTTSPYNPKGNPVERLNRTINSMVAKFCNEAQTDWDMFMGLLVSAYNTTSHASTDTSPYTLVYNKPPLTIVEKMHLQMDAEIKSLVGERGRTALKIAYETAVHYQETRRTTAQSNINKADYYPYQIDDLVWVKTIASPRDGRKAKHTLGHTGPYRVVEISGPLSYVVEHRRTLKLFRVHHYRLSPVTNNRHSGADDNVQSTTTATTSAAPKQPSRRTDHRGNNHSTSATQGPAAPERNTRYPQRTIRKVPARLLSVALETCTK